MSGPGSSEAQPPLLTAGPRAEFELMEDELATVAVFIGYFHNEDAFRAAALAIEARGGNPDGNYWCDPRGAVWSLWEYQ